MIAEHLTQALMNGLTHPGDRDRGQPAVGIPSPFKTRGMPPDLAKAVTGTTRLFAEAIIYEIEKTHAIVERESYEDLRCAVRPLDTDPNIVSVHCRCDRQHVTPLLHLAVRDGRAVIDGPTALAALAHRSPDCPHEVQ